MKKTYRILIQVILALVMIAAGVSGFKMLKSSREALGRQETEAPLPIVRSVSVIMEPMEMTVSGQGTVQPLQAIQVVPEVSGKVLTISPNLVNGGTFAKGEALLQIDPADYEIALTLAEARVKDAESRYRLAVEDAAAAREEWQALHPGTEVPSMVAKDPQLAAAQAQLEAERASLKKAQLQLQRTRIAAPFDGRVDSENVDAGQYVTPGQPLAAIYSIDAAEIVVPVSDKDLFWFGAPGFNANGKEGAEVMVHAWVAGMELTWPGRVVRAEGRIDEKTRMLNVVVRVDRPYATQPPLSVGQFARVDIRGRFLDRAAVIPRSALRGSSTVWVYVPEEERLRYRTVEVARTDSRGVVVKNGLSGGDQVVVSRLKAVSDGMKVRSVSTDLVKDPGESI